MKIGKLSQTVWRRSVLKQLHTKREEVVLKPAVEEMCTALQIPERALAVNASAYVTGRTAAIGYYAVAKALNDLYTRGARPAAVSLGLLFPEEAEEETVKALIGEAEALCKELGIQIAEVQAEVNPAVNQMVVHAEALGSAQPEELLQLKNAVAGQDIVLCGTIGLEGILRITEEREAELGQRFVPAFLHQIKELKKKVICTDAISAANEAARKGRCHITAMQQIGSGGIFASLWEIAEAAKVGLQVDLARMSIRQETVEICEYYQLNPYQMTSAGAVLMMTDDGDNLIKVLEEVGARAVKLGVTTAEKRG